MEKGKTPMDLYQQEVESEAKPQTKEEVLDRFNFLLKATDDHFLKGEVYTDNTITNHKNK